MVDLQRVQQRAPELNIEALRTFGLAIVYDKAEGRPGAAAIRQIINVIAAVHPDGDKLFQVGLTEEANDALTPDSGMTFMVDIPRVRLIPSSSETLALELGQEPGAILDLRPAPAGPAAEGAA